MAAIIVAAWEFYRHIFDDLRDRRSDHWFLMNSVWYPASLTALYLYFVYNLGPKMMKKRPPMQLDTVIKLYDITQVILNLYVAIKCVSVAWGFKYRWLCEPVDYSDHPDAYAMLRLAYVYWLIKIFDLMDTVFFILRKKDKQVSFLHVYHHAGMVFGTWAIVKFLPGGHGSFLGLVNSVVHVVMYLYYFVTNMWTEYKQNLWWKKYVTQLQLAQFMLVAMHATAGLFVKNCEYPKTVIGLMMVHCSFISILFLDFYKKAYSRKTE